MAPPVSAIGGRRAAALDFGHSVAVRVAPTALGNPGSRAADGWGLGSSSTAAPALCGELGQQCQRVDVSSDLLEHLLISQLRQTGRDQLRGTATAGSGRPRSEYGVAVFLRLLWLQWRSATGYGSLTGHQSPDGLDLWMAVRAVPIAAAGSWTSRDRARQT